MENAPISHRGIFWLIGQNSTQKQKKRLEHSKRFLRFWGGRWGSTAVGEARIPLKINILLSSQPTT